MLLGLSSDAYITGLLEMIQLLRVVGVSLNEKSGGKVKIGMVKFAGVNKDRDWFYIKAISRLFPFSIEQGK
jgi:hypothetical protein